MRDIIISFITALLIFLLDAWFCFMAWQGFASAFNLPMFDFWHWAVTLMAVRALVSKSAKIKTGK